ncbi:site-2 protease family protein [Patescibacteria group bacterium]|nr:site-2 protease family protein [Patescibacteria group bacterium]
MSPFISPPFIIAILIAISVHEWGHGFVAYKLGDPTAKMDGRLSLNPLAHLDPVGTVMFLIVGFGWAKPVPIDPRYFKNHKRDTTLVALAGPATNLITAFICFFILTLLLKGNVGKSAIDLLGEPTNGSIIIKLLEQILGSCIFVNLTLMAFNLLPIAPLDGSKILAAFIPYKYEREYALFMQHGPMILLILILSGIFLNVPILSAWVFGIIQPVLVVMAMIAGVL